MPHETNGDDRESFKLVNTAPKPRPATFENEATRQRKLFAGMNCLAGQPDLFATDGELSTETENTTD